MLNPEKLPVIALKIYHNFHPRLAYILPFFIRQGYTSILIIIFLFSTLLFFFPKREFYETTSSVEKAIHEADSLFRNILNSSDCCNNCSV